MPKKSRNNYEIIENSVVLYFDGQGIGLSVTIDREDLLPVIMAGKWVYNKFRNTAERRFNHKNVKLGRFIFERISVVRHFQKVAFKDGDGLNCRRCNLYLVEAQHKSEYFYMG